MSIEERILRLSMDDGDFIDSADNVISKMAALKDSLSFDDISASGAALSAFSGVGNTIDSVVGTAVEGANSISNAFNDAWALIYQGFMNQIGYGLANKITELVSACTIEPVSAGWGKYEESINSVQKMLVNTDMTIEQVEERMNVLATYSDQTSYSYTGMAQALSSFISAGVDIDKSVTGIIGLSNWAATAGVNATTAQGAYDMFAKAVSAGSMSLQQWSSLSKTYGMGTTLFYDKLEEIAIAQEKVKKNTDGTLTSWNALKECWDSDSYETMDSLMYSTLKNKWMDQDLMFAVLKEFGSDTQDIMELISSGDVTTVSEAIDQLGTDLEGFGYNAMKAAQEAKTWTDVIGSWKDATSTAWRGTFENIFGNYEEAASFWTDICDTLGGFFWDLPYALMDVTKAWHKQEMVLSDGSVFKMFDDAGNEFSITNYQAFTSAILNLANAFLDLKYTFEDAWGDVFGELSADTLGSITSKFAEFAYLFRYEWLNEENLNRVKKVIENLLSPLKMLVELIGGLMGVVTDSEGIWADEWGNIHENFAWMDVVIPLFEKFFEVLELVAQGIKDVVKQFTMDNANINEGSAVQHLVDLFSDVWEILKSIGDLIGAGLSHFFGLDDLDGGLLSSGIDSLVDGADKAARAIRGITSPMDAINSYLEPKAKELGLTKQLKGLKGASIDVSKVIDGCGTEFEDIKDMFNDDSWDLMQAIYGGDNPEEAWNNIIDLWDTVTSTSENEGVPLADRLFNGKTFGETVEDYVASSDVSYFDLMIEKIKGSIDNLPDIGSIFQEVWSGFKSANDKYGFNLPESWEEAVEYVSGIFEKLKTVIDTKIKPVLKDLFGAEDEAGTETDASTSIFFKIGELIATIGGAYTNWNTDRWGDVSIIFGSVVDVIKIIKSIADQIVEIATSGDGEATTSTIITAIDSISNLITSVIQGIAVLIDSVGVAMGVTDGSKVDKYGEDLGTFGTVAENIGTIIGNILPGLIELVKTVWSFVQSAAGTLAKVSEGDTFDKVLTSINKVISWIGDLVISLITWVDNFLTAGFSVAEAQNAGPVLQEAINLIQIITAPIKQFITSLSANTVTPDTLGEGTGDSVATNFNTIGDIIVALVTAVVDVGVRCASVLTEGASDIVVNAIEDVGAIVIAFVKQIKLIASVVAGANLTSFAGMASALFVIFKATFTVTGVLKTVQKFGLVTRLRQYTDWFNSFGEALLTFGKFLLILIAAIAIVGYLATHHTSEFIAGCIATAILIAAIAVGVMLIINAFDKYADVGDSDGTMKQLVKLFVYSNADTLKWYALGLVLMALAALCLVLLAGIVAVTAVVALFKGWGLAGLFAGVVLMVGLLVGSVLLIKWIMVQVAGLKASGVMEGTGTVLAQMAVIALILGFFAMFAIVLVAVVAAVAVVITIIELVSRGKAFEMLLMSVGTVLLMMTLIVGLVIGLFKVMSLMAAKNVNINWKQLGQLILIGFVALLFAGVVEVLLLGVAAMMAVLSTCNNVDMSTLKVAGTIILAIVGFMLVMVGLIVLISKSNAITSALAGIGKGTIKPLIIAVGIILAATWIFKKLMTAMTSLSQLKMGSVDVDILWDLVMVLIVLMGVAFVFVKIAASMGSMDAEIMTVHSSLKTMAAILGVLLASFTLILWVIAKYGIDDVDSRAALKLLGIIAVLAGIILALAGVAHYVTDTKDMDELWTMVLGIAILAGVLVVMAKVMSKVTNINTDGMWELIGMIAVITLIVVGLAAVAHFLTTDADIGEIVVLMVGVIALFMALILAAKVLSEIKDVDTGSIDAIQSIVNALIAIAGIAALIGMLISLIPGIGPLAVGLGALFAIAIGAGVLLFAAAIYIVAAALKKLSDIDPNKITAVFSAISEGLGTLFSSAGAIVEVLLGIAVGLLILRYAAGPILQVIGMMMLAIVVIIALIAAAVIATGQDVDDMLGTISTIIDKVATAIPGWFDSILTAVGDCMVKLAEFVGTYTPVILEAVIGGITEAIGGGVQLLNKYATDKKYQDMVEDPSTKTITAYAKAETRNEFGLGETETYKNLDPADQYAYLESYGDKVCTYYENYMGKRVRAIEWGDDGNIEKVLTVPNAVQEAFEDGDKNAYADYVANWMMESGKVWGEWEGQIDFQDFLQDDEIQYFTETYPHLMEMITEETGYMHESQVNDLKDNDYWSKYGEYATEGASEAATEVEKTTDGFMSDVKAAIMDKLGGGEGGFLSGIFENINLGDSFGSWGSIIEGLGFGSFLSEDGSIDTSALLNVTTSLNLTDENGNVLSGSSTDQLNELLSGAGLSGESGSVLDVNTLLNSVITGEELTYNGQVLDISNGDLGTVLAGLVTEQAAETETPAIVTNDVVVEGNTFFNTEDILGDAEVLNTTGVATYESTGQALGAALVKGFYSYYSNIKSKGAVMGSGAVNGVRGKYSAMYSAGKYLCEGFVNAIDDYLGTKAAYRAGQKLGTAAVNGLNNAIAAASPSRKAYQSGIWFGQGAVNGMMDMVTSCFDAGEELGEASLAGYTTASSVTPVIDTSAFKNGVGVINDTFAEASALNADYTVSVQGRMKSTKDMLAEAFTGLNSSLNGISGKMGFSECIDRLGDRIGEMGFYVDGKQFARAMAEHNDTALARTYVRRGRS